MKYEIVDHGICHEQYFQGCGVSFTKFSHVATGIGSDAAEAYSDALEQLACDGYNVAALPEGPEGCSDACIPVTEEGDEVEGYQDNWYYVSVRVK